MQESITCSAAGDVDGMLRYNPYSQEFDFCHGTGWSRLTIGGGKKGWFVLGPTVNGNIVNGQGTTHSINAASARCWTHLQANDWLGKAEAVASDMFWSNRVQAFFCHSNGVGLPENSTCSSTSPNTTYYFAKSGDVTKGGASFTTDYLGSGPFNDDDWSDNNHFGTVGEWWGVRDMNSLYTWHTLGANQKSCGTAPGTVTTAWNLTTGTADYGRTDAVNTFWNTDRKWSKQAAEGNCDAVRYLICMVH